MNEREEGRSLLFSHSHSLSLSLSLLIGLWDGGDVAEVYGFLKRQMDPYHIIEIKGYLQVAPFLGAAAYLALLGVQKFLPDNLFEPAYLLGALVVFGPLAALYFSA